MTLDELGPRICIFGPSNSGKSTLAEAISRACDLPTVHLDQLYHQPNTDWQPRPVTEFVALHDHAIQAPRWVMDGNYSKTLPRRLERATGFILLDVSTTISLVRYFRRSWFERKRRGALEGGQDSVKWSMIHHIAVATRANRKRYDEMFAGVSVPKVMLRTPRELAGFYREAGLKRRAD
jgi:adenylate kinase family enzyme